MIGDSRLPHFLRARNLRHVGAGAPAGFIILFALVVIATSARASSYIVGNGDDGSDLEGGSRITTGRLVQTRIRALARLRRLNAAAVDHLGLLLPELEKTDLYLAARDVHAKMKDDRGPESSPDGLEVYARTFAEPHAATRFFPAALGLNDEQLIALHIHEALHRALPADAREDEAVVTKITLALATDDANLDRVRRVVTAALAERYPGATPSPGEREAVARPPTGVLASRTDVGRLPTTDEPSSVTYRYTSFFSPDDRPNERPIDSLHSLETEFYPFAQRPTLGFGMRLSYITMPNEAFMGPLTFSARDEIARLTHYDVNAFASLSLSTMAGDEIKNSPLGRDVTTFGLSFRRDETRYYIEDSVQVSLESEAKRRIGLQTQTYHYGKVIAAAVRAGAKVRGFELGAFAELLLSDSYRTTSTTAGAAGSNAEADADSGRFRLLGIGPELSYVAGAIRYSLNARWVIDSTPGASLDDIGDFVGYGLGQGSISAAASLRF